MKMEILVTLLVISFRRVTNIILSGSVNPEPFVPTYNPYSMDRMLMFKCKFQFESGYASIDHTNLLYDVRWDFEEKELIVKSNLTYSQILINGTLRSSEWISTQKKMGFNVKCAIRARLNENDKPSPYLEGNTYFAGIRISPKALTITSGELAQVWLYPTVPVACVYDSNVPCKLHIEMFDFYEQFWPGSNMYCNDPINNIKPSLYGLEIDGWKTKQWSAIEISVPVHRDHNEDYTAILKLGSKGVAYDKLWDDYQLDPIEIQVLQDGHTYRRSYCSSSSDALFWTFDLRHYGFHDEGEFLLFKHKTKLIEVHTIQRKLKAANSWTENCAVAVRAASDVFIIYGCGQPKKWIIRRLGCKVGADYLKIYHRWDSYEIHLPSGSVVRANKEMNSRLNIQIYLSHSDQTDVEGMCGNSNQNYWDDYTSRNGTVMNNATLFARSWSVPEHESLFVAKHREYILNLSNINCLCLRKPQTTIPSFTMPYVNCPWQENIPIRPPINWNYDACDVKSMFTNDDNDDIIDVPLDIVAHKEHPELISGTTDFVRDSLNSFTSQCSITRRWNSSLVATIDDSGNYVLDTIFKNMCLNDCKYGGVKTGDCVNGICICFNGYIGDDCRINKTSPPLSGLSEEYVCDSSIRSCITISIYGDGFYPSENLRCRLRPGKLTETRIMAEGSYFETSATYKNTGEIKCDVSGTMRDNTSWPKVSPFTTSVYLVSITTNGIDYSDEVPVLIYNSNCMDCDIVNSFILCSTKSDVCILGDKCQPTHSPGCHTTENENRELKSKAWLIGVIIAVLAVIFIVLFVIMWKKHKRKESQYEDYRFDDVNNYDTLSERTVGSAVSLQNIPPLSTGR